MYTIEEDIRKDRSANGSCELALSPTAAGVDDHRLSLLGQKLFTLAALSE